MLLLLCLAFALLGSIQALSREEANNYIDRVIQGRFVEEAQYNRLDPYKLVDSIPVNFNHTGQKGRATISNGRIFHLSKVIRAGDCTVPHYQSANITFTCFLKFDHLKINYTTNATYDNMEVTFYPQVAIKGTNITVRVTSNREEDIPNLRLLIVNHYGSANVTAKMISIGNLSDIVGPPVRQALLAKTTQSLHKVINGRFKDALAYSIYKTPVGL